MMLLSTHNCKHKKISWKWRTHIWKREPSKNFIASFVPNVKNFITVFVFYFFFFFTAFECSCKNCLGACIWYWTYQHNKTRSFVTFALEIIADLSEYVESRCSTTKIIAMSLATYLFRVVAYHDGLPPVRWQTMTNQKRFTITIMPMPSKCERLVTYLERLLHVKSHDAFCTWSHEITWETKSIMSPLPQCLWLQN